MHQCNYNDRNRKCIFLFILNIKVKKKRYELNGKDLEGYFNYFQTYNIVEDNK